MEPRTRRVVGHLLPPERRRHRSCDDPQLYEDGRDPADVILPNHADADHADANNHGALLVSREVVAGANLVL